MVWTTLQNSTTADAAVVNANYYYVRQGTLAPMAGASMGYTDAAHDLGGTPSGTSAVYRWRDAHLSRDIYNGRYMLAGPATSTGINMWAGFMRFKGGEWPNSPTNTSVIVPPGKLEINGSVYYNALTQTVVIATASDWVTSNANGLTNNTFTWVYAIPTTTGSWIAKLDDRAPVDTFSSLTSGLYHPGTGASGSASYRAFHVIRSETTGNVMLKYWRKNNSITYQGETSTAVRESTGPITGTLTAYTFASVPPYARVTGIDIVVQVNPTSTVSSGIQTLYVGNNTNSTQGSVYWQVAWQTFSNQDPFMHFKVPADQNTVKLSRANTNAGVAALMGGYQIEF